ncbi:Mce protein [Mycobacterium vicinigordonae]|uniref:Mce protein n=1 Tax=Mycobacterium vicinigordonae TaxID=1719132 RepID=A0A7D6DWN7_9MYCO|nr:Mce protein [Mycobacterium vicinigordonae]QLL06368.1 Mce protein [Mycobacterium vicinigordonae]
MAIDVATADALEAAAAETADEVVTADRDDAVVDCEPDAATDAGRGESEVPRGPRQALAVSVALVLALAGLVGWSGHQLIHYRAETHKRAQFVAAGEREVVNLTTIDWQRADADVKRILDGAMGRFFDDFQRRSAPFIELVKQAQSKSVSSATAAGLESLDGDTAQVLVAVTVHTTLAGVAEPRPKSWRMRVAVQRTAQGDKVSNVEFVP